MRKNTKNVTLGVRGQFEGLGKQKSAASIAAHHACDDSTWEAEAGQLSLLKLEAKKPVRTRNAWKAAADSLAENDLKETSTERREK